MEVLKIQGGRRAFGTVTVQGAKNAALPIMAASILASEPVTLDYVPELTDVTTLARVLGQLGVDASRDADGRLRVVTLDERPIAAGYRFVRQMRASFCVLGPLLARRGRARVPLPGGCAIGARPVDVHLRGLAALGADLRLENGNIVATARRLRGADIDLAGPRGPTVTGTANVLSAAVLADGHTTLRNVALEPEIVDLIRFLNRLGARIAGAGTSTLEIDGVRELGGGTHRIIGDRIEAATLLIAAAITRGRVTVTGIAGELLQAVLDLLNSTGAKIERGSNQITLQMRQRPRAFDVTASPFPGIPTDVQPLLTALACIADGRSTIADGVFPERFGYAAELARIGADVQYISGRIVVHGKEKLAAAAVHARDLRGGAALMLAAFAVLDTSTISGVTHIDRGHSDVAAKFSELGLSVTRQSAISAIRC